MNERCEAVAGDRDLLSSRSPVTVAHGLLARWAGELGYVAAAITYRRRGDRVHRVLANGGYATPVADYLAGEFVDDTRTFDHIRIASGRPVCWEDVPGFERTPAVEAVLRPSGFREGSSVALGLERGQVTSVLHVSFARPQVDSTARAGIEALAHQCRRIVTDQSDRESFRLSGREHQILALVAQGASNAEIAAELLITRRTVATHLENIFAKTGTRSRVRVAVRATELGIL
ncbi:helix-turn-helix domain-containing protein [Prescottella agglutinans]|uniref:DNA-binding CsgD family transcriptional regulator n=1 Tax=Prescottella agglutinans TaxID=1644129 RepID=A0ABT6MGB5_9NOCA|nr:helix-turn-helix transcriptional regulator [Prescottella agglutinans]MDH6283365.1 DNA-binding CsgD family transcriptional regulator [Prescottella agglutinans]